MSSKKEDKKSKNPFGKLFNGRASTKKQATPTSTPTPHENPLVMSLPPSRCTSQISEDIVQVQDEVEEELLNQMEHTSIEDDIANKWSEHRVDFASRCTINKKEKEDDCKSTKSTHYNSINAEIFNVRAGPNYKKSKKKLPSLDNLYDVICVRCFKSKRRTLNVVNVLPLPLDALYQDGIGDEIRFMKGKGDMHMSFPQCLVVHFWLPNEPPNMFKQKEDGTGSEVIFYLRPSVRFLQEVKSSSSPSPSAAVSLFQKWYNTCTTDNKMRGRFKCMGIVQNLSDLNMKWLEPYNGKPTLITDSGSVRKGVKDGVHFLEMSVNVHAWAFLAKKSFVSLLPKFKEMKINIGFTIEAIEDEEMPECMLGCASMNYIDECKLLTVPTDLQSS